MWPEAWEESTVPEIDLMDQYPRSPRSLAQRQSVTPEDRALACRFGKDYFDGDRKHGYGGYSYHPRFWQGVVKRLRDHYALADNASVLDVGCGKGFMLFDFKQLMPSVTVAGLDISPYALEHAREEVKPFLRLGNARKLPYPDRSFDLVTAINTVHNLERADCIQALREIQRVSRRHAFVVVDAWRTPAQRHNLERWVLTAKSYLHVDDWVRLFTEAGYRGDYYWFFMD
jgi:ubiquinone/menaquinone biosynthesis C-methylase UbiE